MAPERSSLAAWPDSVLPALLAAEANPVTVDFTTTGRLSLEQRRIEIWLVCVGDRVFITGTPGDRHWLANLIEDASCEVHFKDDPSASGIVGDIACTASRILDEAERRLVLEHRSTRWYREQVSLLDLVAQAPLVELIPTLN